MGSQRYESVGDMQMDNMTKGGVGRPDDAADAATQDRGSQTLDEMSRLLPGAIAQASRQSGRLSESLRPSLVRALRITAEDDPRVLVDALFRVVVPAFGRAFAERIHSWALRVNHFFLRNASMHGFRWRVEAIRTGRPLQDVVRQHTSSKRVKQVFLIHRETGLLLASARQDDVTPLDGDMISSMLTAIQDFVQDSFGVPRRSGLQHIQVGRTQVWIERGESAVLAGIVEGHATPQLRELFHESIMRIHSDYQSDLKSFQGDVAVFKPAQLYLDSCVNARLTETGQRLLILTWLVLAAPVLALAFLGTMRLRDTLIWRGYVQTIAAQPGIVVIESGVRRGRFYIRGLRDPLALDPAAMLPAATLKRDAVDSKWEPFQALVPEWSLLRATQLLNPPDTVMMDVVGTDLRLSGAAPGEWIEDARRLARFLPGIAHLDTSRLVDENLPSKRAWRGYLERLSSEQGIVVTQSGVEGERFFVKGLRDPDAVDPATLLVEAGLPPAKIDSMWEVYHSALPRFALKRAKGVLRPPATVMLKMKGTVLVAEGEASHQWVRESRMLARGIVGVTDFDTDLLVDIDMARFRALQEKTETMQFRFLDRGTELWPGQGRQIKQLGERLEKLDAMGRGMGIEVNIDFRVFVFDVSDDETARSESQAILRRFIDILKRQEIDMRRVRAQGLGNDVPEGFDLDPKTLPRRVLTISVSAVQY